MTTTPKHKIWSMTHVDDINAIDWDQTLVKGGVIDHDNHPKFGGSSAAERQSFAILSQNMGSMYNFTYNLTNGTLTYHGKKSTASADASSSLATSDNISYLVEGGITQYPTLDAAIQAAKNLLTDEGLDGSKSIRIYGSVAEVTLGEPSFKVVKLKGSDSKSKTDEDSVGKTNGVGEPASQPTVNAGGGEKAPAAAGTGGSYGGIFPTW